MRIRYYFDGEAGDPRIAKAVQLVMTEGLPVAMKILVDPVKADILVIPHEEPASAAPSCAARLKYTKTMKVDGKGVMEHFRTWVGTKDTHSWSALKVHFERLGFGRTTIPAFVSKLDILGIVARRRDVMLVDLDRLQKLEQSDLKNARRGGKQS